MEISVVLPAHNEIAGIGQCLERLVAQGRHVSEIVVVDNNSTDGTAEVVVAAAADDKRIRLVREERPGVAFARYAGFAATSGDIIASIDSDTLVGPGWSDGLAAAFENPGVVAGTGAILMHDLPFQSRYHRRNRSLNRRAEAALAAGGVVNMPALSGANSAIRREAWLQIADKVSCRSDIFEDLDRSLLLKAEGWPIALIPNLDATVSGRRLLSGPRAFMRYAACGPRTYRMHGKRTMATVAWAANVIALVTTMATLPINRAWDPDREQFSLGRLLGRDVVLRESPIG